ncbi:MAG: tetratricopeptide repeat protein [Acidobacteria bacterium]|nr:tetratricopeptide repeat protein [Acidobacteriota bacterium]
MLPKSWLLAVLLLIGCESLPKVVRLPVAQADRERAFQLVREGDLLAAKKDFYAALIKYLDAGKLDPSNEVILNKIGIAYLYLNFPQKALEQLRKAVALNDQYASALNNLGSAYFAAGNLGRAMRYYRRALRLKPDEPSFHVNLASAYMEKKDYPRGMEEYRIALRLDPRIFDRMDLVNVKAAVESAVDPEKYYQLARFYAELGEEERALENLVKAVDVGFDDYRRLHDDVAFASLQDDTRFTELAERLRTR